MIRCLCCRLECGSHDKNDDRIVGGKPADPEEYPWMAALLRADGGFCGGALISPQHVLTAAHCLFGCVPIMNRNYDRSHSAPCLFILRRSDRNRPTGRCGSASTIYPTATREPITGSASSLSTPTTPRDINATTSPWSNWPVRSAWRTTTATFVCPNRASNSKEKMPTSLVSVPRRVSVPVWHFDASRFRIDLPRMRGQQQALGAFGAHMEPNRVQSGLQRPVRASRRRANLRRLQRRTERLVSSELRSVCSPPFDDNKDLLVVVAGRLGWTADAAELARAVGRRRHRLVRQGMRSAQLAGHLYARSRLRRLDHGHRARAILTHFFLSQRNECCPSRPGCHILTFCRKTQHSGRY